MRIPGLQSVPRAAELVSLVDLLPTFMDVATGGDPPEPVTPMDGHSLVPLMGGTAPWRNLVVSEYTGEGVCAPCRMVRRDGVKFIYTHGHPDLMYDLDADPLELDNLIGRAAYASIERELREELLRGWDPDRIHDACIRSQKDRMFIHRTTGGEARVRLGAPLGRRAALRAQRQRRRRQGEIPLSRSWSRPRSISERGHGRCGARRRGPPHSGPGSTPRRCRALPQRHNAWY